MEIILNLQTGTQKEHWQNGLLWLAFAVGGGLLPVWIGVLTQFIFAQPIRISTFTVNGEFAIYAAAFMSGSLFIILKDFKKRSFPSKGILALVIGGILFLTALMYAFVALSEMMAKLGHPALVALLNRDVIIGTSWAILPFALVVAFFIFVADFARTDPDVAKARQKDVQALKDNFDKLEGDDNE